MRRSKEEAKETIHKLLAVARRHFTEYGYGDTALEAVVAEAGLTRGAAYHHFKSKRELFRHVLEGVQQEVAERVEEQASASEDVWLQLFYGCRAFVEAAVEERTRRIMLIDGPAIMGWEVWRAMDERHSMRLLRGQLETMNEQGCLIPLSVEAATHLISGALNEVSLWLAHKPDHARERQATMAAIQALLDGLRSPRNLRNL